MSRVVAVIQARMGSSRLPGKSLIDLAGKPLLQHVVERLQRASLITEVVIATSDHPRDNPIEALATDLDIRPVRGSENDVLARYALAAWQANATTIVRVTADCPLIDPDITDMVIDSFQSDPGCVYAANVVERTFPRGCDVEVFSADALYTADREARLPFEREHVTPHLLSNPGRFPQQSLTAPEKWRRPSYRLCVDTHEDLALVSAIYERLGPDNGFPITRVIEYLDAHPDLPAMNAHVEQKKLGQ
jgi:spore coat polysaccharide biosynthesis protein SpsF